MAREPVTLETPAAFATSVMRALPRGTDVALRRLVMGAGRLERPEMKA
jgi:hypothetical protein